jgi:hypothetical protein
LLDFKPADVKHSSLRTMANKVRLNTETQASWANMTSCQCCPTNLRGFYMSFMISGSIALICDPDRLIEATLMYMVQSITIRYESSGPVCL